ncbi:MAG TPA: S-methyl-5-thioribose-1-phosphate isomerase [Thermoanaerobacterales bacterium]|nr:S-methyl-5-thioribose-1-phosphate isomerase [Thermoanaerobacterales bacterium]
MRPIIWEDGHLKLLDQTKLPIEEKYVKCYTYHDTARAIKNMIVRGAPAIGATAAFGMVLGSRNINQTDDKGQWFGELRKIGDILKQTRPTAVNLGWAVDKILEEAKNNMELDIEQLHKILEEKALKIAKEDVEGNKQIGNYGNELIPKGANILTHCNAGALATVGYGTALGVIRGAHSNDKGVHVFVDETRPFLQGARLTAWELDKEGIPFTIITDNMAGHVISKGMVDLIVVGADRIAANGDTANKIGTYTLAVLAKEHNIPMYIAAPLSTIDMSLTSGDEIPIEERDIEEVLSIQGVQIAPKGSKVYNPAFDITPAGLITAIITDKGIIRAPYGENLKKVFSKK